MKEIIDSRVNLTECCDEALTLEVNNTEYLYNYKYEGQTLWELLGSMYLYTYEQKQDLMENIKLGD